MSQRNTESCSAAVGCLLEEKKSRQQDSEVIRTTHTHSHTHVHAPTDSTHVWIHGSVSSNKCFLAEIIQMMWKFSVNVTKCRKLMTDDMMSLFLSPGRRRKMSERRGQKSVLLSLLVSCCFFFSNFFFLQFYCSLYFVSFCLHYNLKIGLWKTFNTK